MSCNDCSTKPSDAKNFSCPPKMADGRNFTDYRPRCQINFTEGNMNSYQYRQHLINNAETMISQNRYASETNNACGPCVEPFDQGTMLPEQTMVKCDASSCHVEMNDPTGLGRGRQYSSTPDAGHDAFVKSQEGKGSCCIGTSADDTDYYTLQGLDTNDFGRYAMPSGGSPISR